MNYEKRIVVYLDILGFKELIDETVDETGSDDDSGILKITGLYELIYQTWDLPSAVTTSDPKYPKLSLAKENAEKGKIVTIFSDSIVISFPQTARGEIFWTLMEIRLLLLELANRGIFCRGAVSVGKLIHTNKVVFGPALVEAYTLESKKAVFPRILIAESIFEVAKEPFARVHDTEDELEFIFDLVNKDEDGYFYIDYLDKVQGEIDDSEFGYCDYLLSVREKIINGLSNPDIRVREKYSWLQKKFNMTVANINSESAITSLLEQGRIDMVEYYSILESI